MESCMKDQRYFLRVASHIFAANVIEDKISNIEALDKFCDGLAVILVFTKDEEKTLKLSNEFEDSAETTTRVIFYKNKQVPLTPENLRSTVAIITQRGTADEAFLSSLKQVVQLNTSICTQNLIIIIEKLCVLIVSESSSLRAELRYWRSKTDSRSIVYWKILEPLYNTLELLPSQSISELNAFLEMAEECIDSLWQCSERFSEFRIKQLIYLIGSELAEQIAGKLEKSNIWNDENAIDVLELCIGLCDQWLFAVEVYFGNIWKKVADNPWKDGALKLEFLTNFKSKLEQVIEHSLLLFNFGCICFATVIKIKEHLNAAIDNDDKSVVLETNAQLLIVDNDSGILSVSYNDRLIKLIRDVRQLTSLGFAIPAKIIACSSRAEKFYKYGIVLKQIAHFYNTIEQQMLPCQQAMMLDEALAFEKLIIPDKRDEYSVSTVTWNDPKKLERYITKLQDAAERLTARNRMLRKAHFEITMMILQLMDTDLFKDMTKWKDILVNIRTKIAEQEQYGTAQKNMRPWLFFWDKQLYKALQIQYQWGIESLHLQMPIIQAQLVFKERKIQLRPPIEEIRSKYYHELKKFLSIPYKFRGVQDTEQVTVVLAELNATRFYNLYEKAENLFANLAVIGEVDLEELIETNFTRAEDWELQIKSLKSKGREAEKLPNEVRLECIVVSTQPVRVAIDDMLQRLYDTLVWTLRNSTVTQVQTISNFLNEAIQVLSSRPQSLEDIATVNHKHSEFAKTSKEVCTVQDKNLLLRSIAGNGVEQILHVLQDWEKFDLMFDSHQMMIKDQVGYLKNKIVKNISTINDECEKLVAHWNQFKPKPQRLQDSRNAMLEAIEVIKENRISFDELWARVESLKEECSQVDIENPEFLMLDDMRNDLETFENSWLLYEQFNEDVKKFGDEDWILFRFESRTHLFTELLMEWREKLKAISTSQITIQIEKEIENFMSATNGLKYCRDDALSPEHWAEVFRLLKIPKGVTLAKLKFNDLLTVSGAIIEHTEELKAISGRARSETTIREAIQELELWAAQAEFTLTDYSCTNGVIIKIVKEWKDAINSVKDSQAILQSVKSSPYYAQFSDKTAVWETRLRQLMNVELYLQKLHEIQRKWVYLEPIFGRGSVPSETARFRRVDLEFRSILSDVCSDTRLVNFCSRNGLQIRLNQIIDQLGRCHRALNSYLEEKRNIFPRFYFIGDDDLLEILGQSTNPNVIQAHLKKLFQGINSVIFDENNTVVKAVVSAEGEIVELRDEVKIVTNVEEWILDLTHSMKSTIKVLIMECINDTNPDISKYPAQVLCLVENIKFCQQCENVITKRDLLKEYKEKLITDLEKFSTIRSNERFVESKLKALMLEKIHHIGIINELLKAGSNIADKNVWIWQKQLRFYRDLRTGNVIIRQLNAEFVYSYEYQVNKLIVQTPLTEKCYLNLTQAMAIGLGGSPYGPAGTGKTETVKALGSLFGRQVLVFNCDEGIDAKSMSRIFVGLVQCGAWGCFDEFNRLDQAVLSAVSTQIQTIQDAIRSYSGKCSLNGREVTVNDNSAIFITMNPASRGYGGRQKLPNNLKQLFRPIVMSVPNQQMIVETILYSKGFKDAAVIARKLTLLFKLSKEMLSAQQHYDWGLRALRTVLQFCDDLLKTGTNRNTTKIIVRALSLSTFSKLTFNDSHRFASLIKDFFPTVEQIADEVKKILELHELLKQRMGVVVLGPSGTGKSTVLQVLYKALQKTEQNINLFQFNPKSMPREKLLGYMDFDTREWFDGVITAASRQAMKDPSKSTWIVCDGDIDPEWVEALNSVLDDNKILTLPTGERIQLRSNVNFIFETDDLKHASPATISRMGMLYVSEEILNPESLVECWLANNNLLDSDMAQWIKNYVYKCLKWLAEKSKNEFSANPTTVVQNVLCRLEADQTFHQFLIHLYRGISPYTNPESRKELAKSLIFNEIVLPDAECPENAYYDKETKKLACFVDEYADSVNVADIDNLDLVQTSFAQSFINNIETFLSCEKRQSFIVYGPEGSGKNTILKHIFRREVELQVVTLHCTANTKLVKLTYFKRHCIITSGTYGRTLKPKYKSNLILYVKAINVVQPDKWGTFEVVSLLQQLLTYHGFYDENLEWIHVEGLQVSFFLSSKAELEESDSIRCIQFPRCCSEKSQETLTSVIIYEINRIFLDCLVDEDDKIRYTLYYIFLINFSSGSMVLAGKSGMGRQAAVCLIAYIHQMKVFSPKVFKDYTLKQFYAELKEAMEYSVVNNEHILFVIEEYQILEDEFIQTLNSVLECGDFPGLFTQQELDSLLLKLAEQISKESFDGDLYDFFSYSKGLETDERTLKNFCQVYEAVPASVSIPLKYIAFINNYVKIYEKKQAAVKNRLNKITAGVERLTEAKETVTKLQSEAGKKRKLLKDKQEEANRALKAISESMTGAKSQRDDIEQLKAAAEVENAKIEKQKDLIEEQLREVEPLLQEAREAVGSIKSESLSEIRSLRAPPETIRDILQAVLLFMGILDTSWEAMRKFLARNTVKEEIINFDAHNVTADTRKKVMALVNSRISSFDPKTAKRASIAAAPLAAWVLANLQYSAILERITPLEREKTQLTKNLGKAEKRMLKLSEGLKNVDNKVAELKANFEKLMKEATEIKIGLEDEQKKINAAGTLVDRLTGEFNRWRSQVEELQDQSTELKQYAILSAAFVTFLGSFAEQTRSKIIEMWSKILYIPEFSLLKFISDDKEQLMWKNEGASADNLSLENLSILFNTTQTSLIIDPFGITTSFLRQHFSAENVEEVSAASADFNTQVELGVRFGKTIVVVDIEAIDPSLYKLLRNELLFQGSHYMITIGKKVVDYNNEFRIFFCTKNNRINLPQCIKRVINEVNFTTTKTGLSSQLLTVAINIEQPELENRSAALTRNIEESKVKLEEVETELLEALSSAEGSLLENTQLLDSLNKSKESAEQIAESLQETNALKKEVDEQRQAYLPLASTASTLYFTIHDQHKYNHMYSFNANTVVRLFQKTITDFKKRLEATVFNYATRALFKSDRLCFAITFIRAIYPELIQQNEWKLFVDMFFTDITNESGKPITWISQDRMPYVMLIKVYLPSVYNKLRLEQESAWKEFNACVDCELRFPTLIADTVTEFQKVLLIQAIRPNRLHSALTMFVKKEQQLDLCNFDLEAIYDSESNENEPVLIITGTGADPSQVLEDLASNKIGLGKLHQISMGQGQLDAVLQMLKYCAETGHWICIKNLHLSTNNILSIYNEFMSLPRHPKFRLWLISEADNDFPTIVLQNSIKITYEPPSGVKSNLLRTLHQWRSSNVTGGVIKMQCLYILAWVHALLQERRTYIPQGWTEFYEFNESDLRVARQAIDSITGNLQQDQIDWEFLRGMMQTVFYGNRIDRHFDFTVLLAYLQQNFNSSVISGRMMELKDNIRIPSSTRIQDYINATESQFPNEDTPSLFGLPQNINSVWATRHSIILERNSLHTTPIPQIITSDDPLEELITLEFSNAVSLVRLTAMTQTVSQANSIIKHQTPEEWQELWRGPKEPYQYISSLIFKATSINELKTAAKKHQLLTTPIKLSKLFRPIALINALRQYTARKEKTSIDELKLQNSWKPNHTDGSTFMEITGLYIQGAIFEQELCPTCSSSPAFSPVTPDLHSASHSVVLPLYADPERDDLVAELRMPCRNPAQWQTTSVALFLSNT
uniref:Cytoplasmic dynein 2 heavy chain 1 n=1 Tax=Syphacia muris TaxID=451379 RepID=A0A158R4I4_9BILA